MYFYFELFKFALTFYRFAGIFECLHIIGCKTERSATRDR